MIKVEDIFQLPEMGNVVVRRGKTGLDRQIRWVHVIDHEDVGDYLEGGELLLACGQVWPNNEAMVEQLLQSFLTKEIAGIIFATGRYLQESPPKVLEFGDRHAIPILEVPFEVSFVKVTRSIHEAILQKQQRYLRFAEEIPHSLIEKIKLADRVTDICRLLSIHLESYVLITDPQHRVLTKVVPADVKHINVYTVIEKLRETLEMQLYSEWSASDAVFEPNQAVFLPSKKPPYVLFVPLKITANGYYTLWIFDPYQPLDQRAEKVAEYVAAVLKDAILNEQKAQAELTKRRREFLELVLESSAEDSMLIKEKSREFDIDPDAHWVIGLLLSDRDHADEEELAWRDHCQRWLDETPGISGLCERYAQQVIVMTAIDTGDTDTDYERIFYDLRDDFRHVTGDSNPIFAISGWQQGLSALPAAYEEINRLAPIVQKRNSPTGIYFADHLQREILLYGQLDAERARLLRSTILPQELLSEKGSLLYETLKSLALHGYNREQAAQAMHIHRNTLRYRIRRLEKLLNERLSSPNCQFWVQVALDLESLATPPNE